MNALKKKRGNGVRMLSARRRIKFQNGFTEVDRTADPQSFVRYLDQAYSAKEVQATKARTFEILDVKNGEHMLDVGCGTGSDVFALARMVGSTGRVVGVDSSRAMINEARRRAKGHNLPVDFYVCDAHRLHFDDNTFDGCHAERTLEYVKNPQQMLSEMTRVLKSGGRMIVIEPDWETLVIDTGSQAVTRMMVNIIRQSVANSGMGHLLPGLFKDLGLQDIVVGAAVLVRDDFDLADHAWRMRPAVEVPRDADAISVGQATRLISHFEKASAAGRFFAACVGFGVVGRKP